MAEKYILYLNTADQAGFWVGLLFKNGRKKMRFVRTDFDLSEKLIPSMRSILPAGRFSDSLFQRIAIVTGSGSFSGLRSSIVIANVLNFVFKVPIVRVRPDEALSYETFLKKESSPLPVLPDYVRGPNITKTKKKFL